MKTIDKVIGDIEYARNKLGTYHYTRIEWLGAVFICALYEIFGAKNHEKIK